MESNHIVRGDLLSVIIPVYNAELFLCRCIDSVLAQDYKNIEVILVDDGSTDESGLICDSYAVKGDQIKVIHQKNSGQSVARYSGLTLARGDYVTFVDSDDWVEPYIFAPSMKRMLNELDVDICVGTMTRDYPNGHRERIMLPMTAQYFRQAEAIEEMISCVHFRWELCSKVYRRSLFSDIRPHLFRINIMEDFLWNWELFHKARWIYFSPDEAYRYYYNEGSTCNAIQEEDRAEAISQMLHSLLETGPYDMGEKTKKFIQRYVENDMLFILMRCLLGGNRIKALEQTKKWCEQMVLKSKLMPQDEIKEIYDIIMRDVESMCEQLACVSDYGRTAVYLYGTGKLAQLAVSIMYAEGWPISGCIISDGQIKTRREVFGVPVFFLSNAPARLDETVVLTSAACYDQEIIPLLERSGYENIKKLYGWRDRLEPIANRS